MEASPSPSSSESNATKSYLLFLTGDPDISTETQGKFNNTLMERKNLTTQPKPLGLFGALLLVTSWRGDVDCSSGFAEVSLSTGLGDDRDDDSFSTGVSRMDSFLGDVFSSATRLLLPTSLL